MTARTSWLVWVAAVLIAGAVVFTLLRGSETQVSGPQSLLGKSVPNLPLQTTAGDSVSLAAYRGRVVVVNLWASWCPPCRAEMPDLQRLSQSDARVMVVGIDEGESSSRATAFARSLRIDYTILLDAEQQYGRAFSALGLPTTVVADRNGTIVRAFDGPLSYRQMLAAVSPYLRAQ